MPTNSRGDSSLKQRNMKDAKLDQELKEMWQGARPEVLEVIGREGEAQGPTALKRRIIAGPEGTSERTLERDFRFSVLARLVPAATLAGLLALVVVFSRVNGIRGTVEAGLSDQELEEIVLVLMDAEGAADSIDDGQFDIDVEDV